jgi:hypothetical protein
MEKMVVSDELMAAYRATSFEADAPLKRVKIRIGEANPDVDNLFIASAGSAMGPVSWAYVTAWNPASQLLGDGENAARHDELRWEVAVRVVSDEIAAYYEGEGVPNVGGWTPGASLIIIGIDRGAASALGARFGQNTIVVGDRGGLAELLRAAILGGGSGAGGAGPGCGGSGCGGRVRQKMTRHPLPRLGLGRRDDRARATATSPPPPPPPRPTLDTPRPLTCGTSSSPPPGGGSPGLK